MIYLYIFIMFVIAFISLYVFKDVLSPAFIFCLPWILSLMGLTMSNYPYSTESFAYAYIVLGAIVFITGFVLAMANAKLKKRYIESKEFYYFKPCIIKLLIIFEIIITVYLYYVNYLYVRSHFIVSIYQSLRHGLTTETLVIPGYLMYARSIITIISVCVVIIYFNIHETQKKFFQKVMIVQLILAALNLMTVMTRNGILIATLPLFITFLVCKNFDNRKIIKYAIRFLIVFLVFFSVIAIMKNAYLNQYGSNSELLVNQFSLYMSGSLVALEKFIESSNDYLYGQNTFRFFYGIINRLFGTGHVQQLVQDPISIDGENGTNVYTFYQYYIKDFGMIYALIVQFFVGILHGVLYRMMLSKKPINIFYFSIMVYPLVMQFFEDQYISLLSTWIQYFLVGWVFFRTNLFVFRGKNTGQISRKNNSIYKARSISSK
ncbi:O-antigen polymerase [Bacillus sp. EB600]|uniref:O-antigen polymerase n=1 Tax=Bacillus sp. EB600 TaxID=2806345 RepID=UPI00210AF1EF|nr:O-antigen polymerase [Bacillus sp. EB600]MCQ6280007.1 oligosaccharide repeat unit polymerase [Bacillus sp. EB600]